METGHIIALAIGAYIWMGFCLLMGIIIILRMEETSGMLLGRLRGDGRSKITTRKELFKVICDSELIIGLVTWPLMLFYFFTLEFKVGDGNRD